ncbi:hypothetical protein ARMGADRAFT_1028414 [Armillaria gallica]|uniref:Uncharacterized protein n=1 Tax=Armillaria gallica TaxID=47427 RepID=A0A2H3E996_ARMGA|nr:hypothetical protein ARMGADRAFT_1028414 [Armillaria gallica]
MRGKCRGWSQLADLGDFIRWERWRTLATTADDDTLSAALLLPVDTAALKKKKKKSKKKATATTVTADSIPQQQQQLDATENINSDATATSLFTFSQAIKEFEEAREGWEDLQEALTRFWRHAYHLGEDDGRFEASREMEKTGYQQGYEAALTKLTADEHRIDGSVEQGGELERMQEDTEAVEEAFRCGKELGLDEGQKTGYYDGLTEGRLELGEMTLEVVAEASSVGRKKGATKEKEYWIGLGPAESGVCRAVRKDLVNVTITVSSASTTALYSTVISVVCTVAPSQNLYNASFFVRLVSPSVNYLISKIPRVMQHARKLVREQPSVKHQRCMDTHFVLDIRGGFVCLEPQARRLKYYKRLGKYHMVTWYSKLSIILIRLEGRYQNRGFLRQLRHYKWETNLVMVWEESLVLNMGTVHPIEDLCPQGSDHHLMTVHPLAWGLLGLLIVVTVFKERLRRNIAAFKSNAGQAGISPTE